MYCIIFLCGSGWGGGGGGGRGESCSILFVFPIGLSAFKMAKNNATVII